jgi:D-tyrosyl-tRNA(Tyr) deacylase
MKSVIQRVKNASVTVDAKNIAQINQGYLLLVGVEKEDTEKSVQILADKIVKLRIMGDKQNKMNLSIKEVKGEILVVSQFTLIADLKAGRRPSFINAAPPQKAKKLYELFIEKLKVLGVKKVAHGIFGAKMEISLVNDGPVTIIIQTQDFS